jgi:hypothetical protein
LNTDCRIKLSPRKDKLGQQTGKLTSPHKKDKPRAPSKAPQPSAANLNVKQKMTIPDATDKESDPSSSEESEPSLAAPTQPKQVAPTIQLGLQPQGRPRKAIINDAAKRMKML